MDNSAAALSPVDRLRQVASDYLPTDNDVLYESRGSLLVIGPAARCVGIVDQLRLGLRVLVLSPDSASAAIQPTGVTWLRGDVDSVTGYLGGFRATVAIESGPQDLGPLSGNPDGCFDLVLDLGNPPLLSQQVLPPGYLAPAGDSPALQRALEALPGLRGRFIKPRYFQYQSDQCAHSRRSQVGCERCIRACPAQAIDSRSAKIHVEPHLCQGCGSCGLVCPTGAIQYTRPLPDDLLEHLWRRASADNPGNPSALLLCEPGVKKTAKKAIKKAGQKDTLLEVLPVLPAVGMDGWLALLAAGVPWLILFPEATDADPALSAEIGVARRLLAGVGQNPDRLNLWKHEFPMGLHAPALPDDNESPVSGPPVGTDDKRSRVLGALAQLAHQSTASAAAVTPLPEGAPFGRVCVDRERCTLCMACVHVCPRGALREHQSGGQGAPAALAFVEADCIQCGLCREGCPESAVTLESRFVHDAQERTRPAVISESAVCPCVLCGEPVASEAMIRQIEQRLRDHPMFQGDAFQRLRMCESCKSSSVADGQTRVFFGDKL